MAESSIKARIAALNLEEVHAPAPDARPAYSYDAVTAKKKPPPPPPTQRPPAYQRQQTVNNPPILSSAPTSARQLGNQPVAAGPRISPALPPRPPPRSSTASNGTPKQTPALPPRRPSDSRSLTRRESIESISTVASGISTLSLGSTRTGASNGTGTVYQVRAPAYDPSKLPPLPPKKAEEKSATRNAMKSKRDYVPSQSLPPNLSKTPEMPSRPSLPVRQSIIQDRSPERPPLPGRSTTNGVSNLRTNGVSNSRTYRVVAPPPRTSVLELGFNNKTTEAPPVPQNRPTTIAPDTTAGTPPPIPLSSRPNLDAILAFKPKPGAGGSCLICRDFSGPDQHAARYPRTQLPSSDVGWLAHQLCSPFRSATDKARAIFMWLHHNVDYDVHSFFNGTISPSTPEKTITSGLAVCEGYAGLFAALALKAGLQALVCSGDGKGFGHEPLKPGQPMPAFQSNHAWNAVCIDNGEWKLIDPCWGAGHIGCQNRGEGYGALHNMPRKD
jgi:transglutaminase-like putative cysteine protease